MAWAMPTRDEDVALPPEVLAAAEELRKKEGVLGVFWGDRYLEREGRWVAERTLCVHVQKKRREGLTKSTLIPPTIDGFRTDVLEVGRIVAHVDVKDELSGDGHPKRSSTITAIAKDERDVYYALVSGHGTLPFDEAGHIHSSYLYRGASELYQGDADLHLSSKQVWVKVHNRNVGQVLFGKLGNSEAVDFALVQLDGDDISQGHPAAHSKTPLVVTTAPNAGEDVEHFSRIIKKPAYGQYQYLALTDFDVDFPDGTVRRYGNAYVIQGMNGNVFSRPGDSGSAVVNRRGEVLGTVLGGSTTKPISYVLRIRRLAKYLGNDIFGWFFSESSRA